MKTESCSSISHIFPLPKEKLHTLEEVNKAKQTKKKKEVFHFTKWSSESVNKMSVMLQEESGSQQSECTKFPNALYHSFAFNICAEKTRAIAFCHQAQRDAHFPFQNSFSALFSFLREKSKCGVIIYSQLTHCASLQIFIRCSVSWKAFLENKAGICKCMLNNVSGYHKIVLEWQSFGHCIKSYRNKMCFHYGYSNYEQ